MRRKSGRFGGGHGDRRGYKSRFTEYWPLIGMPLYAVDMRWSCHVAEGVYERFAMAKRLGGGLRVMSH